MSIRFFYLFFISFFMFSCQEKTSNEEVFDKGKISREEFIGEVQQLYYNDQIYRRMWSVFKQINSECKNNKKDLYSPYDLENDATRLAFRLFSEEVTNPQDRENTKRLLAITREYGFPGMESLGHDIPVFTVFIHAVKNRNKKTTKQIKELIKKEYQAGRVSEYERDIIFWFIKTSSVFSSLKKSDSLFAFKNFLEKNTEPPIPYTINYRSAIEIFKGSLFNEKYGSTKFGKEKDTINNVVSNKQLNREELVKEVRGLYVDDQKYRRMIAIFKEINNKCKGVEISPYNSEDDKTRLAYWVFRQNIIEPQDKENTKRLLAITREYGFPGMERLGHDIPIFMVFAHTPYLYEYKSIVRELIEQEFKAGRISTFAKDYILWHLDGRMTGAPPKSPSSINYRTDVEIFKEALKNDGN